MSEPPLPIDPDERDFTNLLRPGIRELRAQRGPCPSSEELVAFHENRLSLEEAARVRDHVEVCGLCDVQLGRLAASDLPRRRRVWEEIRAFMLRPVFTYSLIALLLFPAYRGLIRPAAHDRIAPVAKFSLDAARSVSQTQKSPFVLAGDDRFFLLSFFIPLITSPPHQYEVVVVRADQTAVVPTQPLRNCDEVGNCLLLCDAALFAPGSYEVRVRETLPGGSSVSHPFPFQITR